jgi:hypothetical protein
MEKTTFLIILVIYAVTFGVKRTVLSSFHKNDQLKWLSQETATYLFVVLFVVLMVVGVLFTKTNDYSNVNEGFDKIRNPETKKRPHRYFDINTYKDLYNE